METFEVYKALIGGKNSRAVKYDLINTLDHGDWIYACNYAFKNKAQVLKITKERSGDYKITCGSGRFVLDRTEWVVDMTAENFEMTKTSYVNYSEKYIISVNKDEVDEFAKKMGFDDMEYTEYPLDK